MVGITSSSKRITPNLSLGIRRYESSPGINGDRQYVWMMEARKYCGCGDMYAQSLVTAEELRELRAFADEALRVIASASKGEAQ